MTAARGAAIVPRTTRLVLADDHALFRETLAELLDSQPTLEVVGQAADAEQALERVSAARPDVVLLDVQMPHSRGAATVRALSAAAPTTRILCLSAFAQPHLVEELLAAGARGFLHKGISSQGLLEAVRRVLAEPQHATVLVPAVRHLGARPEGPLSRREHQVLTGAASAMSNRQIAQWLEITEGTVKRHLHSVYRKLGAVSRIDAVNKAIAASLIAV